MCKRDAVIDGEILGVPISIPVVVEYDYHKAIPACGNSPREPAHVIVTAVHQRIGIHEKRDITFLLNGSRRELEDQILDDIRDEVAA